MLKKLLIISFLILMITGSSYSQSTIKFNVTHYPPYQYEEKGVIKGKGVDAVDQILKKAGIPYTLTMVPNHERTIPKMKTGEVDGMFMTSQNKEREGIAVFKTIMMNNWCWFLKKDSKLNPKNPNFKKEARVGTRLHTNIHKWLTDNGYKVTATPATVDTLPEMLNMGRMDAVFLAEFVFLETLAKSGLTMEKYVKYVQKAEPFGMYISKVYIKNNPGALEKINQAMAKLGIKYK